MSIPGINSSAIPPQLGSVVRPDTRRPATGTERAGTPPQGPGRASAPPERASLERAPLRPQAPITGGANAQGAVPAEPPAGTDPALWSVLTSEERQFFAKTAAMGPLTYGRIKAATTPAPAAPRGVRLDVRA